MSHARNTKTMLQNYLNGTEKTSIHKLVYQKGIENPNEVENQTYIHKENNLMYIEEHSYNLPSPDMIMNSNKVDLNSSNINNKAIKGDEKKIKENIKAIN